MARSAADQSLVGKVLDERYELLEIIGDGGVGVVYSARRVKLERTVAVKVLQEALVEEPGFAPRFEREAVALSRLHHPHCVAVIDFGVYMTRPYLVLEYVPGETVRKLLQQGPFDPLRAVRIALQLLETLEYFHDHHVIHRDLKSENVMLVDSAGTSDFVKVLDFGMAKILTGPGADSQLSKIGIVPGTPSAMAPEQIQQLPPDPRIDIYATGILMYEMIVGRRPFSGDMATVVKMQLSAMPKPPREVLGESALSAELEQVVIKALEKDRIDRFATAAEMATALRLTPEGRASVVPSVSDVRQSPLPAPIPARSSAPSPEASPAAPAPVRRSGSRLPLRAALIAALALAAGAGYQAWPKPAPPPPKPTPAVVIASALPVPAPVPAPAPAPPPAPVIETWIAHRDLAVTYIGRDQLGDAFREVSAAIADNAAQAGADVVLARAAVSALSNDRIAFVTESFRDNPALLEALAETTAKGATLEQRHAAYEGLRMLGQEPRADVVAMGALDVEQAPTCSVMRDAFKKLHASKDPRVKQLTANLRARGRRDPHVRCLKRMLRR